MTSEVSGVDLARQALLAAREQAKKNGAAGRKKSKRRAGQVVRRDGRDPLGLGAAIGMMMTERGLVAPAAGGSVLARWETILAAAAPELAGHVQAVAFSADSGRLDVVPDSPAYGTKLRWTTQKLIAAANAEVPDAGVRALHVLAPAPVKAGPATSANTGTQPAVPAAAPAPRRTPPEGYRRAIEAHRAAARSPRVDPGTAAAIERQTASMRELSRRAFPEPVTMPGDGAAAIEAPREERRRQAAATEAAALRRARAEKAGHQVAPQRLEKTA
jgi:hypothetical protein